jgi:hypothetical protein
VVIIESNKGKLQPHNIQLYEPFIQGRGVADAITAVEEVTKDQKRH